MMLSPRRLERPCASSREVRPAGGLFPLADPLSTGQVNRVFGVARDFAEIKKKGSPLALRHSCATHLRKGGMEFRVIQVLLGPAKLETTRGLTKVATGTIRDVTSPLDLVMRREAVPS